MASGDLLRGLFPIGYSLLTLPLLGARRRRVGRVAIGVEELQADGLGGNNLGDNKEEPRG